jgi:DNA repair ATPase RecN
VENVKDYNTLADLKDCLDDVNNFKNKLALKLDKLQQIHKANEILQSAVTKVHQLEQIDRIHDKLLEQYLIKQWIKEDLEQVKIVDNVKKVIESIENDQNELFDYQEQLINLKHINKNLEKYKEAKRDKKQKIKQVMENKPKIQKKSF